METRLHRPARHAEGILGGHEHVIPQARLEVALELRQVEIRTGTVARERGMVVREIECEIEERPADLLTVHPQMLDVMSMCQFLIMTADLLGVVAKAGGNMGYDWMRYLITRYEPSDGPQNQMVSFMRSMFGEHVLNFPMLKSTAIADAGITKQTLYEVGRDLFTRATYDRAIEALDNVNGEIEQLIRVAWGRG